MRKQRYKVLFCDLDGTLIDTVSGDTFPRGIWDMRFRFDVLDAIKRLSPEYVFVVSNQGGIASGFLSSTSFQTKFSYVCRVISDYCHIPKCTGAWCESTDSSDSRRKPNSGMLWEVLRLYPETLKLTAQSFLMIGDASGLEGQFSDSDKRTASNFGIPYMDVSEFVSAYGEVCHG